MRKRFVFAILISFLSTALSAESQVLLENDHAAFEFSDRDSALIGIRNRKSGRGIRLNGGRSLWSLRLQDYGRNHPEISPDRPAQVMRRRISGGQELTLSWHAIALPVGTLNVDVVVTLPDDSGIADWRLRARTDGAPAMWIRSVTFPRVDGVNSLGDDYLIYGSYLGRLVRSPGMRLKHEEINHPGRWSMQFAAFYGSAELNANSLVPMKGSFQVNGFHRGMASDETGLFLAADDGKGYLKSLHLTGMPKTSTFAVSPIHYPVFPFWPQDSALRSQEFSFQLPYSIKMGTYSGGAGEAAELYRKLVEKRKWMRNGPLRSPGNPISPKVLNCAFWVKAYNGANKTVPEILRMRDDLRVPVNTHWVRYGVNRFDDNNLDYFPTMANYREGVRVLREHGIGVAPYVCCAVWDQDTESYLRYGMERAAARNEFGIPHIWPLAGNQPSAWMNPASPLWRKQYQAVTMKMFGQWGTDGQYLDVLACAGKLCYNTDLHAPHGGTYWTDGNRLLLKDLRKSIRRMEADPFLTTEGFTENYIDLMDCFLTLDLTRYGWKNRQSSDVFPLFSYVYHDHAIAYGSDCAQQIAPEMLRWEMGLSFTWGIQLCYSAFQINPPGESIHDRFTRELARAWHCSAYKFLAGGKGIEIAQIPDPALCGAAPVSVVSPACRIVLSGELDFPWIGPSVPASAWRAHDGTTGLTLANISGKEQNIRIHFKPRILHGKYDTVWQSWPLPAKKIGKLPETAPLEFTIPADRALVLEIRDDSPPAIRKLLASGQKAMLADGKGDFSAVPHSGQELYGCDSALTLHQNGKLELLNMDSGKKLKAVPVVWRKLEGRGGPRGPEVRTFHLLKPTGCTLNGEYTGKVYFSQDVLSADVTLRTPGKLMTRHGRLLLACNTDGKLFYSAAGSLDLEAGTYRIVSYPAGASWQYPDPSALISSLAEISAAAAEKGRNELTGDDLLSGEKRRRGEQLFALGNAVSWLVSGITVRGDAKDDWLIPGRVRELRFQPAGGTLHLLNTARIPQIEIREKGKNAFAVTVRHIEAAANLLRLLYQTDVRAGNCKFRLTSLREWEAAEPLLAEIEPANSVVVTGNASEFIRNRITITNTAPFPLPVRISVQEPSAWELPEEGNECSFLLKPQMRRNIPLVFRRRSGADGEGKSRPVRVLVNYTDQAWTAISEDFLVSEEETSLKPAGPGSRRPLWSNLIRHQCRVAVLAGSSGKVSLKLRPVTVGKPVKELKWMLFDERMTVIKEGKIRFRNEKEQILAVAVPASGVYFIQLDGRFFQVQAAGDVSHYAVNCSEYNPYILHGRKAVLGYFHVKPGAKSFAFSASDGGPLEPGHVIIRDPNGKAVFDYSGNYAGDQWHRISVAPGCADRIWSMEIIPVEDFQIRLRGEVSPWVTPERDAVLKL